jgi:putative ABC transport system permease protein
MKYLPLVWAGIWRRKGRAILTLLSILNAFLLLGVLQGFNSGLHNAAAGTAADRLYTFSKLSQIEPLPMSMVDQIRQVKGVRSVIPEVIFQSKYRDQALPIPAFGVDVPQFFAANPHLKPSPGALDAVKRTRTGAIVGQQLMAREGWKVGDRVPLNSLLWAYRDGGAWPVDIVGTYTTDDKSASAQMLVNYDYVDQGRLAGQGTTSFFLVRIADPNQASAVGDQIDRLSANSPHETKTASEKQLVQDQLKQIGDIGFVINSIVAAVFFALLFSVGAVMMQSIRERIPELAVLKTLGFTDGGILALILSESVVFCVVSAGLGLLLAWMLFPLAKSTVGLSIHGGPVLLTGLGFALLLALLSGAPPAIRGMRLQVVDALAGR